MRSEFGVTSEPAAGDCASTGPIVFGNGFLWHLDQGNTNPFLHAHVWPRFEWEPVDVVGAPVWLYPHERWSDERFKLGPRHDVLRKAIGSELDKLRSTA